MKFAYFVPSEVTKPPKELAYAFDGVNHSCRVVSGGPLGSGTLITAHDDSFKYRTIDQDTQEWRKIPGSDNWLGWVKDSPPGPEDLARESQMSGHLVEMCDGNDWLVPVARRIVEDDSGYHVESVIPVRYTQDEKGNWIAGGVTEKYKRLWEIARLVSEKLSPVSDGVELTIGNSCEWSSEVLAVNYRISSFEVAVLELLDDYCAVKTLTTVLDLQKLAKKKIASSGLNSNPGETEETQATLQPMQTSS